MIRTPLIVCLLVALMVPSARAAVQTPRQFTGQAVGDDRVLLDWEEILEYLRYLDAQSDRMHLQTLGESTLGRPFVMAVVGDEDGVRNRDRIREGSRRLLERMDPGDAARSVAQNRAIVAISLGVHSTEVGAPQASMEILHEMVTSEEPWMQQIRRDLLVLIIPCMNPDGLDIVVDWYRDHVGTGAEGSRPPWLYHHYAGHDNNRDGFFNNLVETAMWSQVLYHDWLPQMIIDEHQMGSNGPRLFIPPFDDPISPSVHRLVYAQLSAAGQQTVSDLTAKGWTGIATSTIFSAEWPGSVRSTGFWHNMLGILSEVASARLATPLHFAPGSLRGRGRGLPEYERRANFLEPWDGGWWRLRNIMDLEKDLTWSMLGWAADHRDDLQTNFHRMNTEAIEAGESQAPYGFVVDLNQPDAGAAYRLVEILMSGGIQVRGLAGPVEIENRIYPDGAFLIPAAQAFRPFLIEMLDPPPYPMIRQGGQLIEPYDVTAWRLPDLLNVAVHPLREPYAGRPGDALDQAPAPGRVEGRGPFRLAGADNATFAAVNQLLAAGATVRRVTAPAGSLAVGDFVVESDQADGIAAETGARFRADSEGGAGTTAVRAPRIGLYSPWGGSMDEGWTRLVLDRYGFEHSRVRNDDIVRGRSGVLKELDVVILPSISQSTLTEGVQSSGSTNFHQAFWPKEYRGGLGEESTGDRLVEWVRQGHTLIAFNHASDWAVSALRLPVEVFLADIPHEEFYAPGTLLAASVDADHPLGWGLSPQTSVYFARGRTFRPIAWPQPTAVPVRYAERDVLRAGFLVGEEHLEGRPAMVDIPLGKGHVVLFGFSPQRRSQTEATFKLVFNALLRASTPAPSTHN